MMPDPMADLSGDMSGGGQQTDATVSNKKEVVDPMAIGANLQRIDRIRSVMGIASGCVAGTLGLTGLEGLFCFIALHIFVMVSIWAWKMNFNLAGYTKLSWARYLTAGIQSTAMSYMLFWTFFYGLVYLY